tara:strand:+ start:545 stop:817 length:273 start_codon:yes stop_codon:yes gene_type:complete
MSRSNPMHHSDYPARCLITAKDAAERRQLAADNAQRIQWARDDEVARKAAYDAHYPDFDEHAAGMCDPRHSLSKFHDGVVVIPAALIKEL